MKVNIPELDMPRIVIVGGGFGGITLAKALKKYRVQVVLFDKNNYHCFQPLLYQVATGGLEPDSIAFPLRKLFEKQKYFHFRMGEVLHINTEANRLETTLGICNYDYLVLATGSKTNFFGNKELESQAVGMKNVPEALDLRSLILQNFEQANVETDPEVKESLLNFVVVGGGPTGVETAGALAELKRHVLPRDFPELNLDEMDIYLVQGNDRVLLGMSEKSSVNAKKALEKMGVHVTLNTRVEGYDGRTVTTNRDDLSIKANTVIWSAGVTGVIIPGLNEETVERGRIKVDAYNRVMGYENIYAIGDIALMKTDADWPNGHPMVSPTAIQQGDHLAKNFGRLLKGQDVEVFKYWDKGSMATIGRNKAVVDLGRRHMKGFIAWMAWMFIHIFYLIGFRNKLVVFINWVWSYITYDKGTRLIIRPYKKKEPERKEEPSLVE